MNNSDLELLDVNISMFIFEINSDYDFDKIEDEEIRYSVVPNMGISTHSNHEGKLEMNINVFDESFKENGEPFYISITVRAFFKDKNEDEDKNIFEKYGINIISMTYPYARAYISALTGMAGITPIQIPPINVYNLLENMDK